MPSSPAAAAAAAEGWLHCCCCCLIVAAWGPLQHLQSLGCCCCCCGCAGFCSAHRALQRSPPDRARHGHASPTQWGTGRVQSPLKPPWQKSVPRHLPRLDRLCAAPCLQPAVLAGCQPDAVAGAGVLAAALMLLLLRLLLHGSLHAARVRPASPWQGRPRTWDLPALLAWRVQGRCWVCLAAQAQGGYLHLWQRH